MLCVRAQPDPADLFPEVAVHGSLAVALRVAADGRGVVLEVVEHEWNRIGSASVPTSMTGREALRVSGWPFERRWSVDGFGSGGGTRSRWLLSGDTDDLSLVAAACYGWQTRSSLDEIRLSAPFVELTGQLEVPDDSSVHAIASDWSYLRADAQRSGWPEYRALIEAAYARPELRSLHAFTSHWSLRIRSAPPEDRTDDLVCLDASRGGSFTVLAGWHGPVVGRTATAEEAVSLAVGYIDSPR
jgi:hypothetical protein